MNSELSNGPVTLGSDNRMILKSDQILLILKSELDVPILKIDKFAITLLQFIGADFIARTSPAGSLPAAKLHSENRVTLNGKYEILISLILQWQDDPRKTMRNQLSLIIGQCGLTNKHDALDMSKLSQ